MSPEPPSSPFWADPGPDICDFCEFFYYTEVGYHCTECDRPVCPSCMVTLYEFRAVLCPECSEEGES